MGTTSSFPESISARSTYSPVTNQEAVRNFVVSGTNLTAKADYEFGSILAKDANSVFNVATGNVT